MRIDSHQHFWKYNASDYVWMSDEHHVIRKDFLPEDLQPLLDANAIDGTIAVQARQMLKETDFLVDLANKYPMIRGVVGWIPLCDSKVEDYLAQYADHKKIVGFRHVVHDETDENFILRADFNAGIKALSRYSLCYDVLIYEKHLPQTIQFIDKHPSLTMIVDHIAKPKIQCNAFDHRWAKQISRLAERDHVYCKLSGMVTEVRDTQWDEELLRPYFNVVLEAFGTDRILFGSDWPVCLLESEYSTWVDTITSLIKGLTPTEQSAIMGRNAARVYLNPAKN